MAGCDTLCPCMHLHPCLTETYKQYRYTVGFTAGHQTLPISLSVPCILVIANRFPEQQPEAAQGHSDRGAQRAMDRWFTQQELRKAIQVGTEQGCGSVSFCLIPQTSGT